MSRRKSYNSKRFKDKLINSINITLSDIIQFKMCTQCSTEKD